MGYAFDSYISSLRQQRQMEAESHARSMAQMGMIAEKIAGAGIGLYKKMQQDKVLEQKAKQAYMSIGTPGVQTIKTPSDIKYESIKNRIDAIKAGVGDQFSFDKVKSKDLDRKVKDYNQQLDDLNMQMTQLDDYRRTEQYQEEKINSGFKAFIGVPDNEERLLRTYAEQEEERQYQKQRKRKMSELAEMESIRARNPSSKPSVADKPTTKYSEMIQKRIDALNNDVSMSDDKKGYMMDVLNRGLENISLASDSVSAGNRFENTLKELNNYKEAPTEVAPKKESRRERKIRLKAEADEKYNRLLEKLSK